MVPVFNLTLALPMYAKVELEAILYRKAGEACRSAGLPFWRSGQRRPDQESYAEFWFRTGRAREFDHTQRPYYAFGGLLQFTLFEKPDMEPECLDQMAAEIARTFTDRLWMDDDLMISTDRVLASRLPATPTRPPFVIIDGSFEFGIPRSWVGPDATERLVRSVAPTLNDLKRGTFGPDYLWIPPRER